MLEVSFEWGIEPIQSWLLARLPSAFRILAILAVAVLAARLAGRIVRQVQKLVEDDDPTQTSAREKRAQTLGQIVRQTLTVAIWLLAATTILAELGIDLKPILAGAGIAGLAIGFGAQTLIKDLISGFFILLENQYRVGDVVRIGSEAGLVEQVNLRTTVLRDLEGVVHVIPNGSVDRVSNMTRDWSRPVLEIGVAYKEDPERCLEVLRRIGSELERDPSFGPKLVGPVEIVGVEQLADSAVVFRLMVKTLPQERWNVLRELRLRVKKGLDAAGIEIPFPHLTLYIGEGSQGRLSLDLGDRAAASPVEHP
jgi:small conductance mechanosensitive channel